MYITMSEINKKNKYISIGSTKTFSKVYRAAKDNALAMAPPSRVTSPTLVALRSPPSSANAREHNGSSSGATCRIAGN
jgi:hypothetical protein